MLTSENNVKKIAKGKYARHKFSIDTAHLTPI